MKKSGGLIAIIGSIISAAVTFMGSFAHHFSSTSDDKILIGLLMTCVFVNIVFSVLSLETKSKIPSVLVIIFSVPCMIFAGGLINFSMGLSLVGGLIVLFGDDIGQAVNNQINRQAAYQQPQAQPTSSRPPNIPLD